MTVEYYMEFTGYFCSMSHILFATCLKQILTASFKEKQTTPCYPVLVVTKTGVADMCSFDPVVITIGPLLTQHQWNYCITILFFMV